MIGDVIMNDREMDLIRKSLLMYELSFGDDMRKLSRESKDELLEVKMLYIKIFEMRQQGWG